MVCDAHELRDRLATAKYDHRLAACYGIQELADLLTRFTYGNRSHDAPHLCTCLWYIYGRDWATSWTCNTNSYAS